MMNEVRGDLVDRYLLTMFSGHPRRYRVIENTVRNKKTQANLFWALNYNLLNWLGSDPTMSRQSFENWLQDQQQRGWLKVAGDVAWLTPAGQEAKAAFLRVCFQPSFAQWTWLTNPNKYAERFLLAIQAVSELSFHNQHYVPLNIAMTEMAVVRQWLMQKLSIQQVHGELLEIGEYLAHTDERLANQFAHTLLGHHQTGWTSDQSQKQLQLSAEEVQLLNRDVWLGVASYLVQHPKMSLAKLMVGLEHQTPISESAWQTVQQFQRGVSVQEIARRRRLRVSTVREHLLEAAIIIPQALDWERILPEQVSRAVYKQYQGPADQWQFHRLNEDSPAEFFIFRLCQIREFHEQNG